MASYAFKTVGGSWQEITSGMSFSVWNAGIELVQVDPEDDTNPDMVEVPASLSFPANWLEHSAPEDRAANKIFEIIEVARPAGRVITGQDLEDVAGEPRRRWQSRALTLNEAKGQKIALIQQTAAAALAAGYPVPGYSGQFLQLRNEDDKSNWLGVQARASKKVNNGHGSDSATIPIRTMANVNLSFTYAQADALMDGLLDWASAIKNNGWTKADAVMAAASIAAVDAIDHTAGWP